MNRAIRFSHLVIAAALVLTGWLHLGALLLSILFSYFTLTKLNFFKKGGKWLAVVLFLVLLAALSFALTYFVRETARALPGIAERAVPAVIQWATDHQIELPFTDFDSLRKFAIDTAQDQAANIGKFADFARGATELFVFIAIGCIIGMAMFINARIEVRGENEPRTNNLYSRCCEEIEKRFGTFYASFAMVMNAQIIIAVIDAVLTAIFVKAFGLPHFVVAVGATFLCGLIPVVGNLASNAIVVALGFTVSPTCGLWALVFLVAVHKLEYFLNSKIIGGKIRCPIWLTLLALLLGEQLMGITGMVLAPAVLHYIRVESSRSPG